MPTEAVLDASALLALIGGEPGADVVAHTIPGAYVSAVNLAEVVGKLTDAGVPNAVVPEILSSLGLIVRPLDGPQAYEVGWLRSATRARGLSLGDRACLALAAQLGLPALTTDRAWKELALDGVEIRLIR